MGCVTQVGEQGWNIGRMVPLVAGWPETVCGTTVDRQCGSSMQANFNGAAAIGAGQLDVVVAAGVEMMSRVPMGSNGGDLRRRLLERWQIVPQGISAEVIADEWGLTREQLDAYSLESHRRAIRATDEGRFERELVPVELERAGVLARARRDAAARHVARGARGARSPRSSRTARHGRETRARSATARRRCCSPPRRRSSRLGLEPRARFVSFGLAGVDPHRMLHGNPQASRARARPRRPRLGRRGRDRGQRGVRLRRAPVHGRHRADERWTT